jgi:glucan phosphoethanolaminetransferase (alkaline phosphatase superfamily)
MKEGWSGLVPGKGLLWAAAHRVSRLLPVVRWGGLVLAIAAIDLGVRWRQVVTWSGIEAGMYAASVLYALLWLRAAHWILYPLWRRSRAAYWTVAAILQALLVFMVVVHFNHYSYFGVPPELLSFVEMLSQPDDSWRAVQSALTPLNLTLLVGLTVGFTWMWKVGQQPPPRTRRGALSLGLAILLTPVFFNNVYQGRGNFLPSVNFTFLALRAGEAYAHGERFAYLPVANRNQLPALDRPQPYNVLWMVGESLRNASVEYAGYPRDNTPYQKAFFAKYAARSFVFEHCYTATIRTNPSVPSIVSGVHPLEFPDKLMRTPLVYKYAKAFSGTRTFVLSAQSYSDYNFVNFFQSPLLDDLVYQENSGNPAFSWDGMDDTDLVPFLTRDLDAAGGGAFFGILHLNGTHFPYYATDAFDKWKKGEKLDDYDNAILYQDYNIHLYLDLLEKRGLLDHTIVLFASDHGEAFGEHGRFGHAHGYPYEEVTHVAAWMLLPPELASRFGTALRVNVQRNVSNLDWVPTVVDLLGLDANPEIRAITSELMGRSLLTPVDPERVLPVQNGSTKALSQEGFGVIRGTRQFLYHPSSGIRLYDIATDPDSRKNLWPSLSPAARAEWRQVTAGIPVVKNEVDRAITLQDQQEGSTQAAVTGQSGR